jgi:hypothetical protein
MHSGVQAGFYRVAYIVNDRYEVHDLTCDGSGPGTAPQLAVPLIPQRYYAKITPGPDAETPYPIYHIEWG